MDIEIRKIIDKYQFDRSIKKYSNQYYFNDNRYFREIKTKDDVQGAINAMVNTIEMYSSIYPLVNDDIEELERTLGKYEIALHKVLQCYYLFDYTVEEIHKLVNDTEKYIEIIKDLQLRCFCQEY